MGESKVLLVLVFEFLNLDDIEKIILLLKEVRVYCVNLLIVLIKYCYVVERG